MPSITPSQTASPTAEAVEKADVDAAAHLGQHRHHPLMRAAGALSEVADQPPLLAGCGAVLAYGILAGNARVARAGAGMLASVVVATAMKGAVKKLVSRTRPNVLLDEGHYEVQALGPDEGPWHSFPSGHTAGSLAAARALARVYPPARWPAYAGAAAVAGIQVPRGAHYPIDVVAGAAVGWAAEIVAHRLIAAGVRARHRGRRRE